MRFSATSCVTLASRLLLACAFAASGAAHAEKADREKDIQMLADRLTADDAKKVAVYEGSVVVTQGTMRITAAKIVVREDAEGYRTYVATGAPVTFRQKRDNVDDYMEGFAERAEFDDRSDILKLFNRAKLRSAQGELTGDFVSYDRGKEFVEVTGGPPGAPATGSRVKATLVPQKKGPDGKPLPRPTPPPVELKPDKGPATSDPR